VAGKSKKGEAAKVRGSSSRKSGEAANALPEKRKRRVAKRQIDDTPLAVSEPTLKVVHAESVESNSEQTENAGQTRQDSGSTVEQHGDFVVTVDRRRVPDRRTGTDRRQENIPVAIERRQLDRRAKVPRRRQIDPTTCERDYTPEEIEFMIALDEYKRSSGRMFPTCSEILEVIKKLGYEKRPQPLVTSPESGTSSEANEETMSTPEATGPETSHTSPVLETPSAGLPSSATIVAPSAPTATSSMASVLSPTCPQPELSENSGCGVS